MRAQKESIPDRASVHAKKGDFGPKKPRGLLGLIFAGYVPLASQSTYPITAYFVANSPRQLQTPSLSLLGKYVIFAIPTFTFTFYFLELTHFLD